jgi:hypothetical protein
VSLQLLDPPFRFTVKAARWAGQADEGLELGVGALASPWVWHSSAFCCRV